MVFELPKLEYACSSLEPYLDAKTMEIHHSKHHQTYTDNFNRALEENRDLQMKTAEWILKNLDKVPEAIRVAVKNNGGGYYNHCLFFSILTSDKEAQNFSGKVAEAIKKDFGSFDKFKELMSDVAIKRFGSGWAWLVLDNSKLVITSTANQDCPLSEGKIPLMCIDVWEHAYYLKYQNKRKDYIDAIWNLFNWKKINELYGNAKGR